MKTDNIADVYSKNLKCDFCGDMTVVARYHANDFIVKAFSVGGLTQGSAGDWAACATCEKLIDSGFWNELVERVVETFFERHSAFRHMIMRDVLAQQLHDLYLQLLQSDFRKVKL